MAVMIADLVQASILAPFSSVLRTADLDIFEPRL
jgi:hypothetical protein